MTVAPLLHIESRSWEQLNLVYLRAHLERLRLRLRRRVLWLRRSWQGDPLESYRTMVISEAEADSLLTRSSHDGELEFYRNDPVASDVSRQLAGLEEHLSGCRKSFGEADAVPALHALVELFGLASFDHDVLLMCLAPGLDSAFARLYAYVQDNVQARHATPHLALTVLTTPATPDGNDEMDEIWLAARTALSGAAALRRYVLITLEPAPADPAPPNWSPMRIDERISDYLIGINVAHPTVARLFKPVPEMPVPPASRELVDRLACMIRNRPRTVVNLVGPPRSGKDAVARAVATRLGISLYRLDADDLPAEPDELQRFMHLLEREVALLGVMLYCHADAAALDSAGTRRALQTLAERSQMGFFIGSVARLRVERPICICPLPAVDSAGQIAVWREVLEAEAPSLTTEAARIVHQFDFDPKAIVEATAAARHRALARNRGEETEPTAGDLWEACREHVGWALSDLAQRVSLCFDWSDIVLPNDTTAQLREIASQVAHRSIVYDTWAFGAKLSRGRGISALFAGPSGTGKTMAAEVLAKHLELDLYRIDLAGVVNKYIGETEKRLRQVFDAAEASGAILFFDECDSLFGKRIDVRDSHDRYANIEINYLLQRMEEYTGLAILATNRKSALDQAFLRRLRFVLDFEMPNVEDRRRIWRSVFPPESELHAIDFEALARLKLSGGKIKNIAINAAFAAAAARSPIRMAHLMRAAHREYAKIEQLVSESEFGRYYRIGPE